METSASCCISGAPDSSAPHSSAAGRMAIGFALASSAMAMPSKPMKANVPGWKNWLVPDTSLAAASPANAPDSAMASMMMRLTLMPA